MIVDTNFDNIEDYPRQRSDFSLAFFLPFWTPGVI